MISDERKLRKVVEVAGAAAVAMLAGRWVTTTHYVVVAATVLAATFGFAVFVSPQAGIMGLLLFAPIMTVVGRFIQLPLGLNEFNLLFGVLVFVVIGKYAITKRWDLVLREREVGSYLIAYIIVILISSIRAFVNFPEIDFVRSALGVQDRLTVLTSQFAKPVMYMGLFYFGYSFGTEFRYRRWCVMAMGFGLLLYTLTMFLQFVNLFPIFGAVVSEKSAGGILGWSNALGSILAMCFVLFLARRPYFQHGWPAVFSWVVVVTSVAGILFTRSRAAWVATGLVLILFALTARRWGQRVLGIVIVILILVSTPFWIPHSVKEWWEKTTTTQIDDPNAVLSGRVAIWWTALDYATASPSRLVFGGGKFDFQSKGPDLGLPQGFSTHHQLMQSLVDEGLVGVLALLILFGRVLFLLVRGWRHGESAEVRHLARLLLIITLVVLVLGDGIDGRNVSWFWFLIGMFIAAKRTAAAHREPGPVASRLATNAHPQ